MNALPHIAVIWLATCSGGCIVLPVGHGTYTNGPAGPMTLRQATAFLKPGESTRERIATRLTVHGTSLGDGKVVAYTWGTRTSTRFFWGLVNPMGGGGGADEFEFGWGDRIEFLLLEFDSRDVLKRYKVQRGGALNYLATSLDDARLKR